MSHSPQKFINTTCPCCSTAMEIDLDFKPVSEKNPVIPKVINLKVTYPKSGAKETKRYILESATT